jgi:single-stranded DNA-binding protein
MTITATVCGTLEADPETREGKNGPFTFATIKHLDNHRPRFVRIVAFTDQARAALAGLSKGDKLEATGRLSVEVYTPEGKPPRASVSIVADGVTPHQATQIDGFFQRY